MQPSYEVWIILALWAVMMLVLWNLHHYAEFLSRKGYAMTIIALSFLLFFVAWFFNQQSKKGAPFQRIALFPLSLVSSEHKVLTPQSVAIPLLTRKLLLQHLPADFRVVPLEWLFEPANLDSMTSRTYLVTLANRLQSAFFLIGELIPEGDSLSCNFEFYSRKQADPLFQGRIGFYRNAPAGAAKELSRRIFLNLVQKELPETTVSSPSPKYFRAYLHLLRGNWQKALALAREMNQKNYQDPQITSLLAKATFSNPEWIQTDREVRDLKLHQLSEALATLSDADSTDAEMARLAAEGFIWREKFNFAAFYLNRALRHGPYDSKAYDLLTRLHYSRYRAMGFFNEIDIFKKALQFNPGDIEAYLELAAAYLQLNKTKEAQKILEQATTLSPGNPKLLNALGQIYVTRGLASKIFATYQQILKLEPNNADAYYNLGIYFYHSGDVTTATRFFKRAIKVGNHRDSRLYLATIAEKQGKLDEAIEYLRERVKLRTGENDEYAEEARSHLFEIMMALGKVDSSGRIIKRQASH